MRVERAVYKAVVVSPVWDTPDMWMKREREEQAWLEGVEQGSLRFPLSDESCERLMRHLCSQWDQALREDAWAREPTFLEVPVGATPSWIDWEMCDFWPRSEVDKRRSDLRNYGPFRARQNRNEGTIHTADVLWAAKGRSETIAAVWLGAFSHEYSTGSHARPPEQWDGRTRHLLRCIERACKHIFQTEKLCWWHHASTRAMPRSAIERISDWIRPQTFREVVNLASIDAMYCLSTLVPVHMSYEADEPSRREPNAPLR